MTCLPSLETLRQFYWQSRKNTSPQYCSTLEQVIWSGVTSPDFRNPEGLIRYGHSGKGKTRNIETLSMARLNKHDMIEMTNQTLS